MSYSSTFYLHSLLHLGKKFVAKEPEKTVINADDETVETEWDEILNAASEEELVDLAG